MKIIDFEYTAIGYATIPYAGYATFTYKRWFRKPVTLVAFETFIITKEGVSLWDDFATGQRISMPLCNLLAYKKSELNEQNLINSKKETMTQALNFHKITIKADEEWSKKRQQTKGK